MLTDSVGVPLSMYWFHCSRSPTLVLATRPRRIGSSRKAPSTLQPAGATAAATAGPEAAIKAAGAGAEAGLGDDTAVKDASAAAAAAEDLDSRAGSSLKQPLGQGVAALTLPLRVSAQHGMAWHRTRFKWFLCLFESVALGYCATTVLHSVEQCATTDPTRLPHICSRDISCSLGDPFFDLEYGCMSSSMPALSYMLLTITMCTAHVLLM